MSDAALPTLVERTRSLSAAAPVIGAHFLGRTAVFVLAEESVLLVTGDGEERKVNIHAGGILCSEGDGERVLTGGDDGKLVAINAQGEARVAATDPKRRWIDHVAAGPDGAIAWSAGKSAYVQTAKRELKSLELTSSAGGLAFAPRGFRVAASHYNGATLWFPNAVGAPPETLEWKGSHLGVAFSPDARFLITAMQEPTLHAWRLADRKDMQMSGYSAKVRSLAFTADGKWLATSGSEQLILWPFQYKDGPMGKKPRLLSPMQAQAARIAPHPKHPIVATAYDNGLVLLVRIEDGAEIVARAPDSAPVTALSWNSDGTLIAYGTEEAGAAIVTV